MSVCPLQALERESLDHVDTAKRLGYGFFSDACKLIWLCSTSLTGKSGDAMREFLDMPAMKHFAIPHKMYLYAILGDYEHGAEEALQTGDEYSKSFVGALFGLEPFYRGLTLYVMARRTGKTDYKAAAAKILKQLQTWATKKGCVNLVGPAHLLSAEDAALHGKKQHVCASLFEDAILVSSRDGFLQNSGLANERYADYLLELDDTDAARFRINQAIDCYSRWGASHKVEMLQQRLSTLS